MFKNLTDILTADCEVVKFNDEQFFYPIFKNGRSSLTIYAGRNNLPLLKNKEIRFVAITPEQSAQTLVDALRSGVKSYVKKDCDLAEIINAVEETWRGNKFFCGQILETIQRACIDVNDIDFESFSCEPVVLSERENEIIVLIAEGLTNAQIAEQLFLSNHTVNTHRKNIMSKLGVKNTAGIVMYAVKTNLVSPNKFLFAAEQA
jgi:DNA-binding NarL/FixJ family response regulator